jgi:hypothetical protein
MKIPAFAKAKSGDSDVIRILIPKQGLAPPLAFDLADYRKLFFRMGAGWAAIEV